MTIRLTRRARDDLVKILAYIGQHDVEAANRVRNAISSTLQLIDKGQILASETFGCWTCEAFLFRAIPIASIMS